MNDKGIINTHKVYDDDTVPVEETTDEFCFKKGSLNPGIGVNMKEGYSMEHGISYEEAKANKILPNGKFRYSLEEYLARFGGDNTLIKNRAQ